MWARYIQGRVSTLGVCVDAAVSNLCVNCARAYQPSVMNRGRTMPCRPGLQREGRRGAVLCKRTVQGERLPHRRRLRAHHPGPMTFPEAPKFTVGQRAGGRAGAASVMPGGGACRVDRHAGIRCGRKVHVMARQVSLDAWLCTRERVGLALIRGMQLGPLAWAYHLLWHHAGHGAA